MLAQLLSRATPTVLGSLLVGAVGSQQANEIQKELALGNITLDDVYDAIVNFTASPAVSYLKEKEKSNQIIPNEEEDKKPNLPEPDPLDLLNLLKDDNNDQDETKSITTSQGEEGTKQITQTLESPTTVSGSELQQSNQGRETTVSGNVPLVKASQEQGVTFFSDILDGELYVPKKQYEDLVDTSQANEATQIWNEKRTGNFENHIFTSIPTFKEAQIVTADAIAKTLPKGGTIIDIGGTEGGFINTIAELNPSIEGIVLDPNPKAEESFLC